MKQTNTGVQYFLFRGVKRVFVFPGLRPFAWSLPLALIPTAPAPSPRPQFASISPGPQFVFTGPNLQFLFNSLPPNLCLVVLAPNLYLLALASNLLFTSSGQDFTTTTTTATYTITTTTITTTTTTTTSTTRDNNNKRCLRGSKIHIKWPLKDIWWKSQVSVMASVPLNWKAATVKEIGGWLYLK